LAELALRYSGAGGYALYALDPSSGALNRRSAGGFDVPQPEDLTVNVSLSRRQRRLVRSYPLRVSGSVVGMLAFSFRKDTILDDQLPILDRMARSIETLYCLPHAAAQLFARINGIETEIVAGKVSARALGLLEGFAHDQALETIERHVDTVLRSSRIWAVLEELLRDGEEELARRQLANQAKALLQQTHGMSEEEAYHYLRLTSRRSRKPLKDVAQELILDLAANA
jgi:hypothetical protein